MKSSRAVWLLLISCSLSFCAFSNDHTFKLTEPDADSTLKETKIECYVQEELVGFISCFKVPFLNNYVLHSFYVYPQYRNKGYGTELLSYACNYLKSNKVAAIYIQPGPFELDKDGNCDSSNVGDRAIKEQRLITLYKNNQFVFAKEWLHPFVQLLYRCLEIEADPEHLMVQNLE